ncbi:hypothetical protein V1279_005142 [Bradyrhizobium sp. AZCC 1610]|uniref:hypothetical protein n=1 Tax=Bradyrhizobium sp. AZCC 1610 TaxID=3117020 RepID=UPI002FF18318
MILRLKLTLQLLAAHRIRSWRDWGPPRLILRRSLTLQTLLVQALLVTPNIVVALRFEVRRKPIHLGNSLVADNTGRIKHSDSGENSQPRDPCALFHFIRILSASLQTADALSDRQKRGFFVARPRSNLRGI